jgi:hypothetical protein
MSANPVNSTHTQLALGVLAEIQAHVLRNAHLIPTHWSGVEVRRWIADTAEECFTAHMDKQQSSQYELDRLSNHNL